MSRVWLAFLGGCFLVGPAAAFAQRQMENLTRGIVAVKTGDDRVFVGWRLFATDPESIAFNLYRRTDGGPAERVNDVPISNSTNYVDRGVNGGGVPKYFVRSLVNGVESADSSIASVWTGHYLDIPIQPIEGYRPGDASIADLDGDGEYELVLHQVSRGRDNSHSGTTGTPILDAYEMDGRHLWRIDLGKNIREGEHYTQFMVYDLDGDGKAELACKTADGTRDGQGQVIGDAAKDWRTLDEQSKSYGRVLAGPEYLTIFSGQTGTALQTVKYIPSRDPLDGWGGIGGNGGNDSYGNRCDRFLACVAYLDGTHPSLVMCRGVYGRTVLAAWDWRNGELRSRWVFDSGISYPPFQDASPFSGMGGHSLAVADVDQDGKDEIVYQAMVVDDNGQGLYSTGLRHGDAMHISDMIPDRPGLEVFTVQENENETVRFMTPGVAMRDAGTGEILWSHSPGIDVGAGLAADIDPRHPGYEAWGGPGGLRDSAGAEIGPAPRSTGFAVWWDGDLLRELLSGPRVMKWNWQNGTEETLFVAEGRGGTRGPNLTGDFLGDWREEILTTAPDGQSLRLYTTTIPTEHRLPTLMHDPQYRLSVAWQNVAYNKPPHPSFFLGHGMPPPGKPNISVRGIGRNEFFANEVWDRIGAQSCLTCHRLGGEAEESQFVLRDPRRSAAADRADAMRHNRDAFVESARFGKNDHESRMLLKVSGGLDHGGKEVLARDSAEYRILAAFVQRVNDASGAEPPDAEFDRNTPPFLDGMVMLEDRRLLRRVTLSLAGRLPSKLELASVAGEGWKALPQIMDGLMREDAFYDRLREGFNDIFLTLGVDGNADQTCLSYEHFEKTRHWYQHYDLSHIADQNERQRTEWKMAAEYRAALLGEPMQLIDHIVRCDRPFTEIVTADYIMVSPYSARGYGVYEDVKDHFKNPEDPFEYIPVKLKALVGRNVSQNQDSKTGFYPHAGLLSTFQYLTRYPTTETNRNRLRARMYYQHFLGVDVLELAARVSDAAAVTARFENPTMQASECVVCHKTLDPVAGVFQDYWQFAEQGVYGKRKGGWFTDMFGAGFEGEDLPAEQLWRSLPWLGERTAKDPRFAVAMVEHVYYILTGRKVLLPPQELDDPLYVAKRRAYLAQRRQTEAIAAQFAREHFNLKHVFKDWVVSDFYRVDGMATAADHPERLAELDDIGLARLLAPEQIERKVGAVFGERWGKLNDQLAALYGGIDSKEVTERASDPSGAMGAIQRTLSNDVACRNTLRDFARPPAERRLFPNIEPDVIPGSSPEADARIRGTIAHLHELVLGRYDLPDSPAVDRSFALFAGIVAEAQAQDSLDKRENYHCRAHVPDAPDDPHYTIRGWRGVLTYLLRRQDFLYE